ncbi:MAG TPA: hypothetical protein VFQ61_12935, partial [Polyangiaceae bacterium]|nr:hypothetical protein [Polyangiaceae bacterium]
GLSGLAGNLAVPLLGLSLAGALVLVSVDRRRIPRKLRDALGLEGVGPLVPLRLPFFQVLYWGTWAAHGYLLAIALGAPPREALSTAGFSPLANVLGFAALLAPAGVGVREAVLMAGLGPVLGAPGAIAAAVLSRVVSLAVDVGTCLLMRAARNRSAAP